MAGVSSEGTVYGNALSVPFADVVRIETVERAACEDFYAALPAGIAAEYGFSHSRIDDGLLLVGAKLDAIVFNRLFALGIDRPATDEATDRAVKIFKSAGVKNWAIQVAPGAHGLESVLAARAFERHPRTWAKFVRPLGMSVQATTALDVREIGAADASRFGAVAAEGFGLPPDFAPWLAALAGRPGWRLFMAFDGGEGVAAGALYIAAKAAWLGFGATLGSHRGRGAQSAILAARVVAAETAGADLITTETGVPLPGEAGPSYKNIQRAGFRIAYLRPNLRL